MFITEIQIVVRNNYVHTPNAITCKGLLQPSPPTREDLEPRGLVLLLLAVSG